MHMNSCLLDRSGSSQLTVLQLSGHRSAPKRHAPCHTQCTAQTQMFPELPEVHHLRRVPAHTVSGTKPTGSPDI